MKNLLQQSQFRYGYAVSSAFDLGVNAPGECLSLFAKKRNDHFLSKAGVHAKSPDIVAEDFGIPDFLFIIHIKRLLFDHISSNRNFYKQRHLIFIQTVPEDLNRILPHRGVSIIELIIRRLAMYELQSVFSFA